MPFPQHHASFADYLNDVFVTAGEKAGAVVSVSMISSPLWMQYLKVYSDVAALLAPILGCTYILLQIGFKLWDRREKNEKVL